MAYTTLDQLDSSPAIGLGPGTVNSDGSEPRPYAEDLAIVTNQQTYSYLEKVNVHFGGEPVTVWIGKDNSDVRLPYVAVACPPYRRPLVYFSNADAVAHNQSGGGG